MFFSEPDDNGGFGDIPLDTGGDVQVLDEPTAGDDAEPQPAVAPVIDYDKMAAAIRSASQPTTPVAPAPAPKMSQEEIDKLLKKWEPDDNFIQKFSNLDTQKDALKELVTHVVEHAEARAQVHTYGELQRLQQTLAPQLQAFEQFQAQQREERFNRSYPQLAKPELKPVVAAVATQLLQTGNFADEKSAFDAVAKGVERVMQATTPSFKLTSATPKGKSNLNQIPANSVGTGGGGTVGTPTPRVSGPRGIELFSNPTATRR
jgi:hypothetical protein